MRTDELIALILTLPDVVQASHFENIDFRVRNKIFVSLPHPTRLVLKLTLEQQEMVVASDGAVFSPVDNYWGSKGWTDAKVGGLDDGEARSALWMAWDNVAPKMLRATVGRV